MTVGHGSDLRKAARICDPQGARDVAAGLSVPPKPDRRYRKPKLPIYNVLHRVSTISHKLLAPIATIDERTFL
jgi:hypothetical protein